MSINDPVVFTAAYYNQKETSKLSPPSMLQSLHSRGVYRRRQAGPGVPLKKIANSRVQPVVLSRHLLVLQRVLGLRKICSPSCDPLR